MTKEKTIDEKIKFVDNILSSTMNMRTYRYFKDIVKYILDLRRENDRMFNANILLQDKIRESINENNRHNNENQ